MDYQVLVKNLFNDMFAFFNGRQAMDLKTLAEAYPDESLLLAFISGLDQALSVPYNDVMKQCYAFYKKYCGRELAEEDWRDIVDGVQIYTQKWQNTWCRGLILALLSILDKEDKDRRGETSDEKQPEDGDTEESGTKDSGTKDSETEEGQQEMDTAA